MTVAFLQWRFSKQAIYSITKCSWMCFKEENKIYIYAATCKSKLMATQLGVFTGCFQISSETWEVLVFTHVHYVPVTEPKLAFSFMLFGCELLRFYCGLKISEVFICVCTSDNPPFSAWPEPFQAAGRFGNYVKIWPLRSESLKRYTILVFQKTEEKFTSN